MPREISLINLAEKCNIYFENALISKEDIIKVYIQFFLKVFSKDERSISLALHTGSIYFDVISILATTIRCLSFTINNPDEIINSLNDGDMILYDNERYRWKGIEIHNDKKYFVIEQDGRGKDGKETRKIPYEANRNRIKPYRGNSQLTDGRGIRQVNSNRIDFISHIYEIPLSEVPSIASVSTIIVAERYNFDRILHGVKIEYDDGKQIELLELITASYYTDSGESFQYGGNTEKLEPVLKVTRKFSIARDLVLTELENKIIGLAVIDSYMLTKDSSELIDLLGRKLLHFIHIATRIDVESVETIINITMDAALFACTKDFLLQNTAPPRELSPLTIELNKQVENIINGKVTVTNVSCGGSFEKIKKAKEVLWEIKNSEWTNEGKNDFLINAYALLNLFITAVFPINVLEKAISDEKLHLRVRSPKVRIQNLKEFAASTKNYIGSYQFIVSLLEELYDALFERNQKYNELLKVYLNIPDNQEVLIIVPKAYYEDIIKDYLKICKRNIKIVTTNRFDRNECYDKIIVVGDISGNKFNPLRCHNTKDIIVFLYECELNLFQYKTYKACNFERKLNSRSYTSNMDELSRISNFTEQNNQDSGLADFTEAVKELDLEHYIDKISIIDIHKYLTNNSVTAANSPSSEVYAIGRFTTGEQILFSKFYHAVVFDPAKTKVEELTVEEIKEGDILVIPKLNTYTQNMVDKIYEFLQSAGRLDKEVIAAKEKSLHWKKVLLQYKAYNGLSNKQIAHGLKKLGSTLKELTIRQWLSEESHTVGPREEKTLQIIGELTQNYSLLHDSSGYFAACRIVRHQRKEILKLIEKAIIDKLSGYTPQAGSILEDVYKNMEKLSQTLELEQIVLLENSILVPTNIINKVLTEGDLAL